MLFDRRAFLTGIASIAGSSALADSRPEYREYVFKDYFSSSSLRGTYPSDPADIVIANQLAQAMPKTNPFEVMQALSQITQVGSTGEVFNERWKRFANPLLVRFFHDIGYKRTPYPGDCTPWCAATTSWCLQRAGLKIPRDPASSQSFLRYGTRVREPAPGDLCVFTTINDPAHGHVGFFADSDGKSVTVLGGNQTGEAATNCGVGYRQSKIIRAVYPINPERRRSVGIHYLSAFIRPG